MYGSQTSAKTFANNDMDETDLKYLVDSEDIRHLAITAVCAGTKYHVACLVKNRVPEHVLQVFVGMWLTHSGVPEIGGGGSGR